LLLCRELAYYAAKIDTTPLCAWNEVHEAWRRCPRSRLCRWRTRELSQYFALLLYTATPPGFAVSHADAMGTREMFITG